MSFLKSFVVIWTFCLNFPFTFSRFNSHLVISTEETKILRSIIWFIVSDFHLNIKFNSLTSANYSDYKLFSTQFYALVSCCAICLSVLVALELGINEKMCWRCYWPTVLMFVHEIFSRRLTLKEISVAYKRSKYKSWVDSSIGLGLSTTVTSRYSLSNPTPLAWSNITINPLWSTRWAYKARKQC